MASITQTISSYAGGISQQPDELKLPGQVNTARNVLPDITDGCLKRPGSKLVASLSDNATATLNSTADGRWFHYYRDETEQYIGQIPRSDGDIKVWRCSDGAAMTVASEGLSGITVDTAGSGYTNAPKIILTNTAGSSGTGATATGTVVNGEITDITIDTPGKNYSEGCDVYVSGNKGGWAIGVAYVTGDQVTNNDYLYTLTSGNHTSTAGAPTHTSGSVHTGGGTWAYAGTVATATATIYNGSLSTLKTYLTHSDDQDIQTLTLNDFTYIVNRNKVTAMSETVKPLRPPEAFIELKKVAYASQYPLNVYDNQDLQDVTTATRVSVEREVDSSNSCNSNAMPNSGTLPGTGSYTGFCGGGSTSNHEDGYCPNVGTKIFAVNPGDPWGDSSHSNGVSSTYSFYRDGSEVGGTEVQESTVTLAANTSYTYAANNSATNITVSTGANPNVSDFVAAIQATNTYQDSNYPLTLTVEEGSETAQVTEQQSIAEGLPGLYVFNPNLVQLTAGGVTLTAGSIGYNFYMSHEQLVVLALQASPQYTNFPAEILFDQTNGTSGNITVRFKEVGDYSPATIKFNGQIQGTATTTRESSSATGKLVATFKTAGDKDATTLTPSGGSAITFTESNSVAPLIDNPPKHLYFRLSTTGQAVPQGSSASPVYRCRYTTTIDLLYGGTGWKKGDYLYVWMKNAKYKITIEEDSTSKVQANLGLIRPVPTSFDSKTTVTPESVLGSLRGELVSANDGKTFTTAEIQQIGNGLYLTRPEIDPGTGQTYGDFNVSTSLTELLNVVSDGVQDIADLPAECKHGYVVKIRNSNATEDDYYVEFVGQISEDNKFRVLDVKNEAPDAIKYKFVHMGEAGKDDVATNLNTNLFKHSDWMPSKNNTKDNTFKMRIDTWSNYVGGNKLIDGEVVDHQSETFSGLYYSFFKTNSANDVQYSEKYKKEFSLNSMAILVRAIFQTREFEERFLKIGLPYRIIGGIKFYERAEIKDCIAYLRVVHQSLDDLSFERIINIPKRSIGDTTIKNINECAKKNNCSLEIASKKLIEENKIKPKTKIGLSSLLNFLKKWRNDLANNTNHNKLLQIILDESGYSEMLKNKKDLENENRLENIKELLNAMKEFDNLESFL